MPLGKRLPPSFIKFIQAQPVFFVATAADTGRVNLSPKGGDTLRVLGPDRIMWLSLSGSGNETAGHLRKVNRITLMWCAFDGDPFILRAYGTARAIHPRDVDWEENIARFPDIAGSRQIYDVKIDAVQTSCGSGVPEMALTRDRVPEDLAPFYAEMSPAEQQAYWAKKNVETIDGMPTGIFGDDT